MPWTLIDSSSESGAALELYGKDGRFMIRANGLELMNGFSHESEIALGVRAGRLVRAGEPRILVGGLGLGYTLAALAEALDGAGTITVAELSGAVIDWFDRYVRASVLPQVGGNIAIVRSDVAALLVREGAYDAVILDVDNGPEPLVAAGNAGLYSTAGLSALHACLAADGVALLWSGFESAGFAARAAEAGFAVTCEPFRRARADLAHYFYILAKKEPDRARPVSSRR